MVSTDALPPVRYVAGLVPGDPLVPFVPPGLLCASTLSPCLSVLLSINNIMVVATLGLHTKHVKLHLYRRCHHLQARRAVHSRRRHPLAHRIPREQVDPCHRREQ